MKVCNVDDLLFCVDFVNIFVLEDCFLGFVEIGFGRFNCVVVVIDVVYENGVVFVLFFNIVYEVWVFYGVCVEDCGYIFKFFYGFVWLLFFEWVVVLWKYLEL